MQYYIHDNQIQIKHQLVSEVKIKRSDILPIPQCFNIKEVNITLKLIKPPIQSQPKAMILVAKNVTRCNHGMHTHSHG